MAYVKHYDWCEDEKNKYYRMEKIFGGDAENRAKFMRDALVAKVDENTAIVTADIFDPEGMKQAFSDPEMEKRLEEMGIEHTIYMLQPAPVPGS